MAVASVGTASPAASLLADSVSTPPLAPPGSPGVQPLNGSPRPFSPLAIAAERCKGCSLCVVACAKGSLALDLTRVNALGYHPVHLVDAGSCTSCAICARVCPDAVFTVYARPREA